MLTDDGYRQIMQHARRLAQGGRGELAQHLRDAIDLRAEVEALKLERTAAELVHRETATTVLMQMAEVQRLRDAPQQAEPAAQIGWADEFGNLFPMGAWKPAQRTHHDSHKTAWRAVYLHPPAAEVQRLKQERDGLKNRLEWRHDGGPDGISARDETIKMQDAEVRRLQEALEPFTAIDLTTNQAVDAMDVLRARRALEWK